MVFLRENIAEIISLFMICYTFDAWRWFIFDLNMVFIFCTH